jgi:hypothetical protein
MDFIRNAFFFALTLLLSGLSINRLIAQNNQVGIGEWRSHLSYESIVAITESQDAVYYGSSQAILKVNKEDLSFEYLNKVGGLSDMGISTIEYNLSENLLVVAYNNGNIDLYYKDGLVVNLSSILNNTSVVGDKSVNHILNDGKKIYFSCSFGLVVYDLDIGAFSQTTFTSSEVNACARLNDTLFISTNAGIYSGVLDGRNLLDFGLWELQDASMGLNALDYTSKNIIFFQDKLYADVGDTLIQYVNGQWRHLSGIDYRDTTAYSFWKPSGNNDYINNYNFSLSYDKNDFIITTNTNIYHIVKPNNDIYTPYYAGSWRLQDMVVDQNDLTWAADLGYMHHNFQYIKPDAPYRNLVSDMHVDADGVLWVTSSNYNTNSAYFNPFGVFKYENGFWSVINKSTRPELDTFFDAIKVLSNPVNNKIYVGSFMSGLLEIDAAEDLTIFDQYSADAPLNGADGDPLRTRIMGLAVDDDGVLWMTNSRTYGSLLVARKLNGEWKSFPSSKFNDYQVEELAVDRNGYKWIKQITGRITVFDSGVLNDDTDDRSIQLGDNNTVLPNNNITTLRADKNGVIWVGTNEGITIFNCAANLFDGACQGNRPIISQDNFNGYLLGGEEILSIEIDGANRKWVGTKNGLFLLSDDGYEQLLYLNKENSPLFDNEINKLAFDGRSGTLYVSTSVGMQSFRTESTAGVPKMTLESCNCFPHPVESGYDGPIAFPELADMANVKITDISGRLVYETTALGGQAVWYGTDYNGRRAQTGVYLVYVVNESGGQKKVCKLLFNN